MEADELQASLAHWRTWVGRTETRHDTVTAAPLAHWLYFLPRAPQSALGDDGHPRRGGFLPPVPLTRRMWAGGRLEFLQPLRVGDTLARTSRTAAVDAKHGRSGPLAYVTVRHEITGVLWRSVWNLTAHPMPCQAL
ncbi:MAG: MaoC family dehydratase N-terminal domain-containing protein [Rubrivivax sp.]